MRDLVVTAGCMRWVGRLCARVALSEVLGRDCVIHSEAGSHPSCPMIPLPNGLPSDLGRGDEFPDTMGSVW
jgi:hypothetical protein